MAIPDLLKQPDQTNDYLNAMSPFRSQVYGQPPGGPVNGNDMLALFTSLATNLNAQAAAVPGQQQLARELVHGHTFAPGSEPRNPWTDGTFQSAGAREAAMRAHTGAYAPSVFNPIHDILQNRASEEAFNRQGGNIAKYLPGEPSGARYAGDMPAFSALDRNATEYPALNAIEMNRPSNLYSPSGELAVTNDYHTMPQTGPSLSELQQRNADEAKTAFLKTHPQPTPQKVVRSPARIAYDKEMLRRSLLAGQVLPSAPPIYGRDIWVK